LHEVPPWVVGEPQAELLAGAGYLGGLDTALQHRFEGLWAEEAETVADDLADRYWFAWPWMITRSLVTAAPSTYERIVQLARESNQLRARPAACSS